MGAKHAPFGGSADYILGVISLLVCVERNLEGFESTHSAVCSPHCFSTCVILRPRANFLLLMTFHLPLEMV